jgi:hypothetical protein
VVGFRTQSILFALFLSRLLFFEVIDLRDYWLIKKIFFHTMKLD